MTEIMAMEGRLTVNASPQSSLLAMWERIGMRKRMVWYYHGRFEHAFVTQATISRPHVSTNLPMRLRLTGAVQAVKMGCASQDTKIHFNVGRECTAADESAIGGIVNVGLFCIRFVFYRGRNSVKLCKQSGESGSYLNLSTSML